MKKTQKTKDKNLTTIKILKTDHKYLQKEKRVSGWPIYRHIEKALQTLKESDKNSLI